MTRIIVDDLMRSKLADVRTPVELCDAAGRVLGQFRPILDPSEYEGLEPQISEEELRRRLANKGKTYTTAEVLAHLEKL